MFVRLHVVSATELTARPPAIWNFGLSRPLDVFG